MIDLGKPSDLSGRPSHTRAMVDSPALWLTDGSPSRTAGHEQLAKKRGEGSCRILHVRGCRIAEGCCIVTILLCFRFKPRQAV